jgi:2-hydroxychromene-2-carboxylate isomerase
MTKTLEFFFDYTSPYSYLAATQVEALCARTGATLRWRPFLLGAVFKATSNASPATVPLKARYMYKDLGDWTRLYGLPEIRFPPSFPMNSMKADRLGMVAEEQGKLAAFTHAVYRAVFAEGRDAAEERVLCEVLAEIGLDPKASLQRADSPEIKERLRANTDDAVKRGAFGAPTFFVDESDMYVGNDRLPFVERALMAGRRGDVVQTA